MSTPFDADVARAQLSRDGYCVLPQVLNTTTLRRLRRLVDRRLEAEAPEHFQRFQFHGSMLPLDWRDRDTCALVTHPTALAGLAALGFSRPKWLSGYIISKPARAPALWWHQDWWAWDEPASFEGKPPQLFVMYYLTDVNSHNGCLRVIPGSHRRPHPLHRALPDAHSEKLQDPAVARMALGKVDDEVSIPVHAGDALIGDVRLLHATHENNSVDPRTCLTLWYLPDFEALADSLKAYVVEHPFLPPAGWWQEGTESVPRGLQEHLPTYDGQTAPARYNRTPPANWPN